MQIQENVPLAPYTTFRIGGPARFFCRVESEADILEALRFARQRDLRTFILGGGSNLLVSDEGFDGLVLHIALAAATAYTDEGSSVVADVAAGTNWDTFVLDVCHRGFGGVECMAGIPGLVGGTPVQNVGAYGQEVAQTIVSVTALDLESLTFTTLANSECGFGYRSSIFNSSARHRYIVTSVRFRLIAGAKPNLSYPDLQRQFTAYEPDLLGIYYKVREIRSTKGMLLGELPSVFPSAGSFFKNPIVPMSAIAQIAVALSVPVDQVPNWPVDRETTKLPAAWLVDQAGFHKGFALGDAGISNRHSLAIVNRTGHATCADILRLRDRIVAEVSARFGIALEQEPVYVS